MIFISYSRNDSDIADRICKAFDAAAIPYFIDRCNIRHGDFVFDGLAEAIDKCDLLLFLASRNSYGSVYTVKEINYAVDKRKAILPYIIDQSQLPRSLAFLLSDINWMTIEDHPVETDLVNDIRERLGLLDIHDYSEYEGKAFDFYEEGNLKEAFKYFQKAALEGSALSQHNSGIFYYNGDGVQQNIELAVLWFERAARQNYSDSMLMLGKIYQYGCGPVEKDIDRSLYWFNMAAGLNIGEACFDIGYIYYTEEDLVDVRLAAKWFERALSLGYTAAEHPLEILKANDYI